MFSPSAMYQSVTSSTLLLTFALFPLVYICLAVWRWLRLIWQTEKTLSQFPCPERHWLYGTLKDFKVPNHKFLEGNVRFTERFKRAYVQWIGPWWGVLVVCHPETVKAVLKGLDPKGPVYSYVRQWLGDGLLTSDGQKWARNRRLLTPAFHFDILKPYIHVYNSAVDEFLDKVDKSLKDGKSTFPVFKNVSLLTLDVILNCAFSFESHCQTTGENHPYIQAVYELCSLVSKRQFNLLHLSDTLYYLSSEGKRFIHYCEVVHRESEYVISQRKAALAAGQGKPLKNKKYLDFLDILLTTKDMDGSGLSDTEIREEVDTFLFEGHDTTASGISWALYALARHPEHQACCRQEVDEVLNGRSTDHIEWSDLPKLKHLTHCLKETLRMYPPVSYISRKLSREITVDGKRVPVGTNVQIPIYNIHHNPEVWTDQMKFLPERFEASNTQTMHPFAFIPFSAGPRNCIGQNFALNEEKVILARILRRYEWSLGSPKETLPYFQLVLRFEKELDLKFTPRCL
ncbi:ultra-long-chain fatty acid omega-hydroxylase-like [Liolophura sinensis]|uniref:ultra-long-chain fatty acid omega-hydroxylase-like n=1 Tax=Liolophura sinensis TaxID=3198878 RepID=UPI0031597BD7